jgi:hypothetical protein
LRGEFEAHGLELNIEKSFFTPQTSGVVLGVLNNLEAGLLEILQKKKVKIVRGIKDLLAANRRGGGVGEIAVSARLLAKAVGRIMALHVVCGDVVRRMTRSGYALITKATGMPPGTPWRELKVPWDLKLTLDEMAVEELEYWREVIPVHEGSPIQRPKVVPTIKLTHDAGEDAWCAILDRGDGVRAVAQGNFTAVTRGTSSARRELRGLHSGIVSFAEAMKGQTIVVYGDNQSAAQALEIGSKTADL